jgi:chemotaxis signal transduction protein
VTSQPVPASGPREETHALFALRLGADLLLAPVDTVVAVLATEAATPLPRVPPHVLGLVNHDHRALAVLDLARFLERSAPSDARADLPRTVVLRAGGLTVGVPVSAALGVVSVPAAGVKPVSGAFGPRVSGFLKGECETRHGVGGWLDVGALLEAARV